VSGSLLFLAIVGIWAFVLIPRWIRRQHTQPRPSVDAEGEVGYECAVEYDAAEYHHYDEVQDASTDGHFPDQHGMSYAAGVGANMSGPVPPARPVRVGARPSRSRMLRARRRLLTMHLLLTAVTIACAALKVTTWLVVIPPAGMLGMYLLLLRETAIADAEQAGRRAAMAARVWAARQRAYAAALEREAEQTAQIIDISARVGDQLYDQYADATVRAVGD
jgi:hypothetical protein